MVIEVLAAAKLTLSLRITRRRDDGYHEIEATMTTLDLADRLEIDPIREPRISSDDSQRSRHSAVTMLDAHGGLLADAPSPAENLVTQALRLAQRQANITIHKRIPAGAGLGGGSADAAAVLRWAGFTDHLRASSIGADVAFCLRGGRAGVRGIGEVIEPVDYVREQYTLLIPPLSCNTALVYATWDEMGAPSGANGNDLEPAALKAVPQMERYRDDLGNATGITPRLAGSGSTWFVPGAHPAPGHLVATTTPASSVHRRPGAHDASG